MTIVLTAPRNYTPYTDLVNRLCTTAKGKHHSESWSNQIDAAVQKESTSYG